MMALLGILIVAGAFAGTVWMGAWILRPLDRAARDLQHPTQFTLIDFLCLFFLVQVPTGLIHGLIPKRPPQPVWVLTAFSWLACAAMWWISVRTLCRAGIHNPWHHVIFLAMVLPVTFFSAIAAPVLPMLLLLAVANGPLWLLPPVLGIGALFITVLYLFGRFTRRMVAGATPRMPTMDVPAIKAAISQKTLANPDVPSLPRPDTPASGDPG